MMAWVRLQLAIVIANHPEHANKYPLLPGQPDYGSEDRITKTDGYKKFRAWFLHLSPLAKARARRWMKHWIDGTAKIIAAAEASGDYGGLRGLTIDYIDTTGAPLPSLTITNEEQENVSEHEHSVERNPEENPHAEAAPDDGGSGGDDR